MDALSRSPATTPSGSRWSRSPARSSAVPVLLRGASRRASTRHDPEPPPACALRPRRVAGRPTGRCHAPRLGRAACSRELLGFAPRLLRRGAGRPGRASSTASPSTARRSGPTSCRWSPAADAAAAPARRRSSRPDSRSTARARRARAGRPPPGRPHDRPAPRDRRARSASSPTASAGCSSTPRAARRPASPPGTPTLWLEEPLTLRAFRTLLGAAPLLRRARRARRSRRCSSESADEPAGGHRPARLPGPPGRRAADRRARPRRPGPRRRAARRASEPRALPGAPSR